ncbi:MAG TPA: hypothetical protein VN966_04355 [Candidatus Bathyarchaeia archaeon]|nr:hypothetical protein [Candidatus Bathyarchaeia archaeon]
MSNDLVITLDRFDQLRFASIMNSRACFTVFSDTLIRFAACADVGARALKKREERRALSLSEFVDRHSAHFSSWSALALVAKDKNADLWRLKCPCGKTWVGENRQLGIELG